MIIVWDEPKRLSNLAARGLDFASLTVDFFSAAVIFAAKQGRFLAVGIHNGNAVTVVYKPLGTEAISIISMRRASTKERKFL
jgi:uncharacterized DUF497 family protein